jgi:CheY-like chemotaxis protein
MFITPRVLAGKRVLVVEDELLVALLVEDFLVEFGCVVIATCSNVAAALDAAQTMALDLAVLDVNLNGERSYPVADMLTERRIPFLLTSGYGEEAIPQGRSDWKVCTKPFTEQDFGDKLAELFDAGTAAGTQQC